MNQVIKAIKATLAYPNHAISLFDCMELNERAAEQGRVARAAIRQWRFARAQAPILRDVVALYRYGKYCSQTRRLAEQEIERYREAKDAARVFTEWYLDQTQPQPYIASATFAA